MQTESAQLPQILCLTTFSNHIEILNWEELSNAIEDFANSYADAEVEEPVEVATIIEDVDSLEDY